MFSIKTLALWNSLRTSFWTGFNKPRSRLKKKLEDVKKASDWTAASIQHEVLTTKTSNLPIQNDSLSVFLAPVHQTINWCRGTNKAARFTHMQLHPWTAKSKQNGYICSSICRCVTEHRLIVLEIYISPTKLPYCQTTRSTHPCPFILAAADYACKRLLWRLSIVAGLQPRKSTKPSHCPRANACWVTEGLD